MCLLVPHLSDHTRRRLHVIEGLAACLSGSILAVALLVHQTGEETRLGLLKMLERTKHKLIVTLTLRSPDCCSPFAPPPPTLFAGVDVVPVPPEIAVVRP